ncbi:protein transporter Sec31 [Streptomyces sp. NBC_00829]|uniref:protein transporter Sec31 n=1 Tax=Streptomyces sp. NBC_00829 TaxID=2903679 RepID=UPI00386A1639|nr:protein transporter Sec31 [Streptomyces sp. NBC_00829]
MKTRSIERTRLVPHTINGKTEMVLDRYTIDAPVPPRDWDRIVLAAVTACAGLLVTASVIWSTASIGDLLALVVIAAAAYGAAIVFDLLWIMCMALEWLARYDPPRARLPRLAGHASLAVAMVAVAAHGWLAGQEVIGVVGAAVSGIAKGGWTVVMRHHAKPLDALTQQWVEKQRAEVGGRLAMVTITRELTRHEALVDAERLALRTNPDADPDASAQATDDPDEDAEPARKGPMTIADAVRTAADCGIHDPDAVLRYVRKVADANVKPETVQRYIRALRKGA